jgi:hypothetical protein
MGQVLLVADADLTEVMLEEAEAVSQGIFRQSPLTNSVHKTTLSQTLFDLYNN